MRKLTDTHVHLVAKPIHWDRLKQTNKSSSSSSRSSTKVAFVGLAVPLTKWYNITKSKNVDTHWFENVPKLYDSYDHLLWSGVRACAHIHTHTQKHTPAHGIMTELGQSHEGNANTLAELTGRPTHTRSLVSNYSFALVLNVCAGALKWCIPMSLLWLWTIISPLGLVYIAALYIFFILWSIQIHFDNIIGDNKKNNNNKWKKEQPTIEHYNI